MRKESKLLLGIITVPAVLIISATLAIEIHPAWGIPGLIAAGVAGSFLQRVYGK
jgi:hypothetical protein